MMGVPLRVINITVLRTEGLIVNDVTRPTDPAPAKVLSPAAQRALAEAEARRADYERQAASAPKELGGRGGQDPARYGDWEVKGIAADF
ncbi:DUF1674 domain-containing protein [Nitratireductor pacificus]|uniref:DUF1674 domain-containing protein n=1 Tax=Nitratireductor pacificus TaxID=1231180 RepID=UPI00030ED632|nr:DUF1674 domain-containing protein [Nitratireductor pacificus]